MYVCIYNIYILVTCNLWFNLYIHIYIYFFELIYTIALLFGCLKGFVLVFAEGFRRVAFQIAEGPLAV